MKKKSVVLNDTDNIWPNGLDGNEAYSTKECYVKENCLTLILECDDVESFLFVDAYDIKNGSLLLALKTDKDGVKLAYQCENIGWKGALISCNDPDCLHNTDKMSIDVVLGGWFMFVADRQAVLPDEFASALRSALLKSRPTRNEDCDLHDFNAAAIAANPDIGCVIPEVELAQIKSVLKSEAV
jgi:hypothetical protein